MAESPIVFDRNLLRARRRRAAALGPATFLIDRVAEDFSDRLATVLRRFELAVDLGTPTDAVRRALVASGKVDRVIATNVIAGNVIAGNVIAGRTAADAATAVVADEEALPFRDAS